MPRRGSSNQPCLNTLLEMWVKLGILKFWQSALPEDQVVVPLLKADIASSSQRMITEGDWDTVCYDVSGRFTAKSKKTDEILPLVRLFKNYQLELSDLFLVSLLGGLQTDHLLNMAIAELQLPDKTPNLSVHTLGALVSHLFDESSQNTSYHLIESPLIEDGILTLSGDGTFPLKKLEMAPLIWSVLSGKHSCWPGSRYISKTDVGSLSKASFEESHNVSALISEDVETLVIRGVPNSGRMAFAYQVATHLKLKLVKVPESIWLENSAFRNLCYLAGWLPVVQPVLGPGQNLNLNQISVSADTSKRLSPLIVIMGIDGAVEGNNIFDVKMTMPSEKERLECWNAELSNIDLAKTSASGAILSLNSIQTIAKNAKHLARKNGTPLDRNHISTSRQFLGTDKLRVLAEPIHRKVERSAMAFTQSVQDGLDLLLLRASQRESLWKSLGETLKVTPNSGVRALFVGESGTGKTMAASFIASELGSPLYRVDLSSVMNKYIGESEKNLSQLLDYAAAMDVVLLFDEADSLFGSRSEGKETGERFANMLTNFLLTRIENHPGVVILTTNGKDRIDNAFSRRIDVEVNFPQPSFEERLALWRGHLGIQLLSEAGSKTIASYCDFSGGQVRNAVLAAATYAQGDKITIETLLKGIRLEYAKLGRNVPKAIESLGRAPVNKLQLSNTG